MESLKCIKIKDVYVEQMNHMVPEILDKIKNAMNYWEIDVSIGFTKDYMKKMNKYLKDDYLILYFLETLGNISNEFFNKYSFVDTVMVDEKGSGLMLKLIMKSDKLRFYRDMMDSMIYMLDKLLLGIIEDVGKHYAKKNRKKSKRAKNKKEEKNEI